MANAILFNGSGIGAESSLLTATKDDVLEGYEYIGADTDDEISTGTLANNGAINKTISFGDIYKIPYGYHNGSGIVKATNLSATTATSSSIINGKYAWSVNSNGIKSSLRGSCVSNRPMYTGKYITFAVRGRYYASGGTDTDYRCRAYFTVPAGKTMRELFGGNVADLTGLWKYNYITTNVQTQGIGVQQTYWCGVIYIQGTMVRFSLCGSDTDPLTNDYFNPGSSYITEDLSNYGVTQDTVPYDGWVFGNSGGL